MQPTFSVNQEEDNPDEYSRPIDDVDNPDEYSKPIEEKEVKSGPSWYDVGKDLLLQPILGAAQAVTYPADLIKLAMVAEGISGADELEELYFRHGKADEFDKAQYLRDVAESAEFFPNQDFIERQLEKATGINFKPTTGIGEFLRKAFTIGNFAKSAGSSTTNAALAGITAAGTTGILKSAGAGDFASEVIGDLAGAGAEASKRVARNLTDLEREGLAVADRYGIPFPKFMTRNDAPKKGYRISDNRLKAFENNLNQSSEEAFDRVLTDQFAVKRFRDQGADLEVLEDAAWDTVYAIADQDTRHVNTNNIVNNINRRIQNIRSSSPTISEADRDAIRILEEQRNGLLSGQWNSTQLVNQRRANNSNVRGMYRNPNFNADQQAVAETYAFVNDNISQELAAHNPTLGNVLQGANRVTAETNNLARAERIVTRGFQDGKYNPKALLSALNSREGQRLRRDIGDAAVNEMYNIARYGQRAQTNFKNLVQNNKTSGIKDWGPMAGLLFFSPKAKAIGIGAKMIEMGVGAARGRLLMNPATRHQYKVIMENAANNSFRNMKAEIKKLEDLVVKQYGSIEDFNKAYMDDIKFWNEEEEG